jgi:hypothetical protein
MTSQMLNEDIILDTYDKILIIIDGRLGDSLETAINEISGILRLMSMVNFPESDVKIFNQAKTNLDNVYNDILAWSNGEGGATSATDLEKGWGISEGTLNDRFYNK